MKLSMLIKKRWFKALSVFIAFNMLYSTFFPLNLLALTEGPSQPEAKAFKQAGTDDMVNLFTGDLSYNIDLLTVPGPGGGYPVNLSYNAGPTMEQEASWVGLGWNINPGSINRQMRGIPDDFSGEKIIKELYMRPNRTISIGLGFSKEKGVEFDVNKDPKYILGGSGSAMLHFNNYTGFSYTIGASFSAAFAKGFASHFTPSLGMSFGSKDGLGVTPSMSLAKSISNFSFAINGSATFSSRQGFQSLDFNSHLDVNLIVKDRYEETTDSEGKVWTSNTTNRTFSESGLNVGGAGPGISFASSSAIPHMDVPRTGENTKLTVKVGKQKGTTSKDIKVDVGYAVNEISKNEIDYSAYGYLYSENRPDNDFGQLMDFYRDKDVPVTSSSRKLPVPIYTYDIYNVTGQGLGGVFRPFRSDVGVLKDGSIEGQTAATNIGLEGDAGDGLKLGLTKENFSTEMYSGPWREKHEPITDKFKFTGKDDLPNKPYYEPSYFKASGEQPAVSWSGRLYDENAQHFEIGKTKIGEEKMFTAQARDFLVDENGSKGSVGSTYDKNRKRRVQSFQHLTYEQLYGQVPTQIPSGVSSSQIAEITVVNPDGNRYVFGQPLYNITQKEVIFSVETNVNPTDKFVTYVPNDDNTKDNSKGQERLYSAKTIPAYAYTHLITAVLSPDYVDLTGNGPSEDDFGTYVKFDYSPKEYDKSNAFIWRAPYYADVANFVAGALSRNRDDKATYTYGEKEMTYLKTIETKTHIAKFTTSFRKDGIGVADENGGQATQGQKLKKLDKIELFDKETYNNGGLPIKTVHFAYSYDLCGGILPNNSGSNAGNLHPLFASLDANANHGKLTLHKVWFTYNGLNSKTMLTPYEFDYGERDPITHFLISDYNPDYNNEYVDRWGNYQANPGYTKNHLNPYVKQLADYNESGGCLPDIADKEARDYAASPWCLRKITLPSGGIIEVEYEADDYAYVQDKKAMQMCRIVATGKDGTGTVNFWQDNKITKKYTRIYFELEEPIAFGDGNKMEKLKEYIKGIENMYYKTFMKLKREPFSNELVYDYVEGYAELDIDTEFPYDGFGFYFIPDCNYEGNDYHKYAYVRIKQISMNDKGGPTKAQPMQKAGWQYLKLQRSDLFGSPSSDLAEMNGALDLVAVVKEILQPLNDLLDLLIGYYKSARVKGYCNKLDLDANDTPSYIRLNSPDDRKYGGGYRVKTISLNDSWAVIAGVGESTTYSKEYDYTLEDGTSSGVAEYEPLIGGEEIPHRMPVVYSSERHRWVAKDRAMYVETPLCEALYPGANVGYSRVTVKNTPDNNVTESESGIGVYEFYTAKDYPIIEPPTILEKQEYKPWPKVIPFVGTKTYNSEGFSQGYLVKLNDMHGKQKSIATYHSNANPFKNEPISITKYKYKTKGGYNQNKRNELVSEVPVKSNNGPATPKEIGKTVDFWMDMRENYVKSEGSGFSAGVAFTKFPTSFLPFIPMYTPVIEVSEGSSRSVTTVKVISQTGILESVQNTTEGATVLTENLIWDAETGAPVYTTVTNEFRRPVYTMEYPAHWFNSRMGGAYKTWGMIGSGNDFIPGEGVIEQPPTYYQPYLPGDPPIHYWSNGTDLNGIGCATSPGGMVVRSGYRNQQSVIAAKLVSLSDLTNPDPFQLFVDYNNREPIELPSTYIHTDCWTGLPKLVTTSFVTNLNPPPEWSKLVFDIGTEVVCNAWIYFSEDISLIPGIETWTLTKNGNEVKITNPNTGAFKVGIWNDPDFCSPHCQKDILHAETYNYTDQWTQYYEDALASQDVISNAPTCPYAYGEDGNWAMNKSWLFDIDRKQSLINPNTVGTDISKDGTYSNFVYFNWDSNNNDKYWTLENTVTKHSPYGYELENKDILGNYSSALYGYDNSVVTAVAGNTPYFGMAYDGFEDHGGTYDIANGRGHILFKNPNPALDANNAHTGNYSIKVVFNTTTQCIAPVDVLQDGLFSPLADVEYYFSVWVKTDGVAEVEIINQIPNTSYYNDPDATKIEGWQQIKGKFIAQMTVPNDVIITLKAPENHDAYFDDFRILKFRGRMKSYVYYPDKLWLRAELDENNYATFYNYDEEGNLVQVKKETERGIVTLSGNRSNVAQ